MSLATIPEALDDIRQGKMVILVDDEDRENEGDLCMAAESAGFHVVENNIANEIGRRRKFGLSHLTETFLFWIM